MPEPLKISTAGHTKTGKVDIDGNIWTVKLPGAGTELRLSQCLRAAKLNGSRINLLDKKIDAGTITEAELDQYEEYVKKFDEDEQTILTFFTSMFQDDTEDNSDVKKWVEETPMAIIEMAFTDIKGQANQEESDGPEKPSDSTK